MNASTRLTIGIPAYNNERTLRVAVETLLAQTYGDFKLLISDDNSSDNTAAVCLELASLDHRIEYVRQPINLKYQNFGYLLRRAETEYFMWAAGDDRWHPEFARRCIEVLDSDPGVVLVSPQVMFEVNGEPRELSYSTFPLLGTPSDNIRRYLAAPGDNSRMYGIFRTEAGRRSFPAQSFHAYDWAFCAATLRFGGHAEIPEVLMYRDQTPGNNYRLLAKTDGCNLVERLFPTWRLTRWLIGEAKIQVNLDVLKTLLALNVDRHLWYAEHFYPHYSQAISPLSRIWRRHVEWRLLKLN